MIASEQCWLSQGEQEVLRVLEREPRGALGLDIVAKSSVSRAFIYVVLGKLEERGLVSAKRTVKPGHANRPIYSITEDGRRMLARELGTIGRPIPA
jgi:DNA-binding PadR family transcriptional regulator